MKVRPSLGLYKPILLFSISTLCLLSFSRLLLVFWQFDRVTAVDGFLYVVLQGLRFDLIIVCALILIPLLLVPLLGKKKYWLRAQTVFLVSAFSLVAFMEVATPTFILEYDLRPNILFVEYLAYPQEVFLMLVGGYKLNMFIGLTTLAAIVLVFTRFLNMNRPTVPPLRIYTALLCSSLILVLCAIGIRSSLGHRPANPAMVAFSTDLLVNDLILSSLYSTLYAAYSSAKHEQNADAYGQMPLGTVFNEVRNSMVIAEKDFASVDLPTLYRAN